MIMQRNLAAALGLLSLGAACALAENATTPGKVTAPYPTIIHLAVEHRRND